MCIRNVVIIFFANRTNKIAAHNSKRGIDVVLRGATHDFVHTNRTVTSWSADTLKTYKHAPYAYDDASENPCISVREPPPVLTHLGILIVFIFFNLHQKCFHLAQISSDKSSSHLTFSNHNDCIIIFSTIIIGPTRPNRSKRLAMCDNIFRYVHTSVSDNFILYDNQSLHGSQNNPTVFTISSSKSNDVNSFELILGIFFINSALFAVHLAIVNPPLPNVAIRSFRNCTVSNTSKPPVKQSSTQKLYLIMLDINLLSAFSDNVD